VSRSSVLSAAATSRLNSSVNWRSSRPKAFGRGLSTFSVPTTSPPGTFSGTVIELRADKKWSPLASIVLNGGTDGKTSVSLRLSAILKVNDMFFVEMRSPNGPERIGLGGMIPRTQDPIPFSVALDAGGKLVVKIAGSEASTDVGAFQLQGLTLNCSTGDFEFKDVTIRRP